MPTTDDRQPPPRFNAARYCLAENARLRGDKTALVMVGDGIGKTIITGSRSVANGYTTLSCATFSKRLHILG